MSESGSIHLHAPVARPLRTLANLWTRLRSPRPNRATGGYLLTGTSAPRDDEFVAGRRHLLDQGKDKDKEQQQQQQLGRRAYAPADECLINVTDFSDIQISEGTGEAAAKTITELRVPTITTTNNSTTIHSNSNSSNINSNSNSSNINNSNMSRLIQPRYRFRDLLLGDFSFNDDGER
ncbi:GM20526 [Drosophila sechellia]|uniref:GM20526 n=1 Tax=Drosophila sechellia TaxID=7238 RepID=B4HMP3_DROSE|nr:GM20526 [Drosophila sechellia]